MIYSYNNRYIYDIITACKEYKFLCSDDFWDSVTEDVLCCWNGIGAKGEWYNKFIPTHIFGVDITLASAPHDYIWGVSAKSYETYAHSNLYLFYNIICILRQFIKNKWLLWFGMLKAFKYYLAVSTPYAYEIYLRSTINE